MRNPRHLQNDKENPHAEKEGKEQWVKQSPPSSILKSTILRSAQKATAVRREYAYMRGLSDGTRAFVSFRTLSQRIFGSLTL